MLVHTQKGYTVISNDEILRKIGFTDAPTNISQEQTPSYLVQDWLNQTNFKSALQFYGLDNHVAFHNLFNNFMKEFKENPYLQSGAYILSQYLFSQTKYNWTHDLKRSKTDPLPALILLSGHKKHQQNMKSRKFDEYQKNRHRFRIFETCTRGIDVYHINGSEISQLIWGSLFINAHILEFGRLQYELIKYDYKIPNFINNDTFCINIHVPRGEKLDNDAVSNSLECAKKHIPTYFPETPDSPQYFIDSWLMDNNLDAYLSDQSNIRLFRNRFDILHQLPESSISKFLFNTSSNDVSTYPSDTTLRKKIKYAIMRGEKFHDAIAVLKTQNIK